jgi:L-fucose mutarotase
MSSISQAGSILFGGQLVAAGSFAISPIFAATIVTLDWRGVGMLIGRKTGIRSKRARDQRRDSMLKSIDPLLNADVLYALRAMGHGDDLVICDTNFPADSVARETVLGELLRIDNVSAARAARAILSVMPLDSFVDQPALRMEIVGSPDQLPDVQNEVQAEIDAAEGRSWPMGSVERFEFYERAKNAYCVIQTGERRFYGCFILKKGVIPPEAL